MEELHEVAKEFDSHHLRGGGGTGTTGIRTRVHSQSAINTLVCLYLLFLIWDQ